MDVKTFKKLFVHRSDVYAIQRPNGTYNPEKAQIDDTIIDAHLEGRQTIGLYQVMPVKNTLIWAVVDIDIKKEVHSDPKFSLETWKSRLLQQAQTVKDRFKQHGMTSYIEFSGFKGYHVWIFFENPVDAGAVQHGLRSIFKDMTAVDDGIAWELFPKQAQVSKGSLGNLVKGPVGYHHKAKRNSEFIDKLDLDIVRYTTLQEIKQVNAPYLDILNRCSALKTSWDMFLEKKEAPNFFREVLGYLFLNTDGGEDFIHEQFFKKMNNYNAKLTQAAFDHMNKKIRDEDHDGNGYCPITCAKLQDEKYGLICPKTCKAIGRGKSPIAFYSWKSAEEEAEVNATNKMDFLFKKGNAYYEKIQGPKGASHTRQISSFTMTLKERLKVSDGITDIDIYKGNIKKNGFETDFQMSHEDFVDEKRLTSHIYRLLGPDKLLIDNIITVRNAINKHSNTKETIVLKQFGFDKTDEDLKYPDVYRSPSVLIDKEGVHKNDDIIVDLSTEEFASSLDLQILSDGDFNTIKTHIKEELLNLGNYEMTRMALAYTFLGIIFPFLDGDKARFSFFVRGESGKGKSYIMAAFQNFYGNFESITSWSSTANVLGRIGYFFKDALFLIDDFKKRMFGKASAESAALTLLQNYADNTARSRMTMTLETAPTYVVRGWVASTGEDTPGGEASNLARMVPITFKMAKKDLVRGRKVMQEKHKYSGFTARYIHQAININPIQLNKTLLDYVSHFYPQVEGQPNDVRVARNIALLATSFKYIARFLWTRREAAQELTTFITMMEKQLKSIIREASAELASERFLAVLKELLTSGRVRLQRDYIQDLETDLKIPIIGFYGNVRGVKEEVAHILTTTAMSEVQKFLRASAEGILAHAKKAIISELADNGKLYDSDEVVLKMNKRSVRVLRIKTGLI